VLVYPEQPRALVEFRLAPLNLAQATPGITAVITVEGVDGAYLRDEIGNLIVCTACRAPGPDRGVREALAAMLDAGHLCVMHADGLGKLAPRETRVKADLPETVAERLSRVSVWTSHFQVGWYSLCGTPSCQTASNAALHNSMSWGSVLVVKSVFRPLPA